MLIDCYCIRSTQLSHTSTRLFISNFLVDEGVTKDGTKDLSLVEILSYQKRKKKEKNGEILLFMSSIIFSSLVLLELTIRSNCDRDCGYLPLPNYLNQYW